MDKYVGKNISKNVSGKYSQKLLDRIKQSATDALKMSSKRVIQKTTETTGDLIDSKIANTITKIHKISPQNNSETSQMNLIKKCLKKDIYLQKKDRMVPLKCLSSFSRTLKVSSVNCEINLDLKWSKSCVIVATNIAAQATTFSIITDTKLYVPVATLSSQDNTKLLEQLKSGFKRTTNWNKHQEVQRVSNKRYYLRTVEMENFNVMTDQNFFEQPVRNDLRTFNSIRKIPTVQGDDYTTGSSLGYDYFKNHYKMIATDLSKQQALDVYSNAIQQINFTGNLERPAAIFFIIEEAKETVFDFHKEL